MPAPVSAVGGAEALGARRGRRGRGVEDGSRRGRRRLCRRRDDDRRGRRLRSTAWPTGSPTGVADGLARRRAGWSGGAAEHRAEVQERRSHQLLELVRGGGVAGHVHDDVLAALDQDLGLADTGRVDTLGDDAARHVELVLVRRLAVDGLRRHRQANAALQVEAELGLGLVVAGHEDERVEHDNDDAQDGKVSAGLQLSGGCGHVCFRLSDRSSRRGGIDRGEAPAISPAPR